MDCIYKVNNKQISEYEDSFVIIKRMVIKIINSNTPPKV